MFDLPWVLLYPDRPEIRTGLTVVVAGRTLGVWTLNPARVVTTFADHDQIGFAYGTVEGHAAVGEERFEVSLDASGEVRYRIAAYSRLEHPLIRAAGPLARRIQDRFTTGSLAAMHRAVRL
jgi:uncharacterized protein (UPF0548 family)